MIIICTAIRKVLKMILKDYFQRYYIESFMHSIVFYGDNPRHRGNFHKIYNDRFSNDCLLS